MSETSNDCVPVNGAIKNCPFARRFVFGEELLSLAIVSVELTFFMSAPAAGTVALTSVFPFSFSDVVSRP